MKTPRELSRDRSINLSSKKVRDVSLDIPRELSRISVECCVTFRVETRAEASFFVLITGLRSGEITGYIGGIVIVSALDRKIFPVRKTSCLWVFLPERRLEVHHIQIGPALSPAFNLNELYLLEFLKP